MAPQERRPADDALAVAVELTDFSVYYSQGVADSIAAEMKEGKSEVVCEQGKLIKLSKDKQGVITRDVLTKKWTDWVDYWAVDFDYESRKEIIKVAKNLGVEGANLPHTIHNLRNINLLRMMVKRTIHNHAHRFRAMIGATCRK
jgi:hypothetical protein